MILNVQEVVDRVKRTFGDEAAVQVTDADILRWINDAQLQISVDNSELLETVGSADIVSGQADYSQPSDLNTLRSLMWNNKRLRALSFAEFNEYLDGFKIPAGQGGYGNSTPEVFMVYGGTITLFPTPNQSLVNGLKIYYSKHPATVSNLADNLGVPTRYHNSVVEFCLKQAYELDENPEMMMAKGQSFQDQLMKLKNQEKTTTNEYYPTITTLPEDAEYWNEGLY